MNETRAIWDVEQNYVLYHFVRQSQRFPDVILRSAASIAQQDIIMGIELKGWYALAKEREPSFRYVVTPAVCAPADLLVVFPWALSNVVSGTPRLFQPCIVGARYAALYRNWHWQHKRSTLSDTGIVTSTMTNHYPAKTDPISDVAKSDGGGNFGRFARTGLMDTYIDALYREELLGIPLGAWQRFLSLFAENRTEDAINREPDRMAADVARGRVGPPTTMTQEIVKRLGDIVELLGHG